MKKSELEMEYKKHGNMIRYLAFYYSSRTRMDYEDVVGDFGVEFCKVAKKFKKEKGFLFGTFLQTCLNNRGKKLITHRYTKKMKFIRFQDPKQLDITIEVGNPEDNLLFKESLLNNKDEVVRSIGDILATHKIPKGKGAPGVRGWLEMILKSFGFKQIEVLEGFKKFKQLY